tara:strand:- start:2692 stop:3447 length:756 start_codon:yes stop_codon:yes gene_type:complete
MINYFDLGPSNGIEIDWIQKILSQFNCQYHIYAIEANKPYYMKLQKKYNNDDRISLFNYAISQLKKSSTNLYIDEKGDDHSIYVTREGFPSIEKMKPLRPRIIRFSNFIKDNNIDLDTSINIVKMNIVGAEWEFFNDIVNTRLHTKIDIFCGKDDGVEKIRLYKKSGIPTKYRQLLDTQLITVYPFSQYYSESYEYMNRLIRHTIRIKYNHHNYFPMIKFQYNQPDNSQEINNDYTDNKLNFDVYINSIFT